MTYLTYSLPVAQEINVGNKKINSFDVENNNNIDWEVVESFGSEWTKFNSFSKEEIKNAGDQYFDILPPEIDQNSLVLDVGCGTGRWTKYLHKRVKFVEAVDPSNAVYSAANLLQECTNVRISRAGVDNIPFDNDSFDLVFSLGVLHHIPDTLLAMKKCVEKVRPGGFFLVYLYYSLDNRGLLFKTLFKIQDILRKIISSLPKTLKNVFCDILAATVYMPFVLVARFFKAIGMKNLLKYIPLSYYADKSFNIIRNDSLDRFGTSLEQRFSRLEIESMMKSSGLVNIKFSEGEPYWHAIGQKLIV